MPPNEQPNLAAAPKDWLLWQLLDSAFPTGSFAHSGGIEAAWQHDLLADGDALRGFVVAAMHQAANGSLPILLAVLRRPSEFARWDLFLDATLSNHVANRASRAQGRALLAAAERTFGLPQISSGAKELRQSRLAGHLPAVFGLVADALEIDEAAAARAFCFMTARGLISAAVRLGVVGPMEGQQIQADAGLELDACATAALAVQPGAIAQTAFLADLLQATQDRLYSRLFQS